MSFAPLALVVVAAFIHATWNLLAKQGAPAGPVFVFAYNLVCCIAYAPWVIWLLAHGAMPTNPWAIGFIVLSGLIHLAYSLCLQQGYRVADLSIVYPVARGTGPLLASVGAFVLLGEHPTAAGLLGLAAVVSGILMISTQGRLSAFSKPGGSAGLRWGAATGSLIAGYMVSDAYAVRALGIQPVVLDWFSNLLRFVLLAPLVLRDTPGAFARMKGYWGHAIGVGLLSPLAYILVLTALRMDAPLSLVAPAREMSMMVGALFGMVFLREPVGAWRLGGCALLVAGVALLGAA